MSRYVVVFGSLLFVVLAATTSGCASKEDAAKDHHKMSGPAANEGAAAEVALTDADVAKWTDYLKPSGEQNSWSEIGWRDSIWDAVLEARELGKPLLVWSMNGHPKGCTGTASILFRRYEWTREDIQQVAANFVPVAVEHRSWQDSIPNRERDFPGFVERSGLELYDPEVGYAANLLAGVFTLAPDGTLLQPGITNQEVPKPRPVVIEYLKESLELFAARTEAENSFEAARADYERLPWRWGSATNVPDYARKSMVLKSWSRDLPRPDKPIAGGVPERKEWFEEVWNSDFMWIERPQELLPSKPVVGAVYSLPQWWAWRLVRFHLVDNVAGLTRQFPRESVKRADIFFEVIAVNDERLVMRIFGKTRAVEQGRWILSQTSDPTETERGFESELLGQVVWNYADKQYEEFSFVAIGTRWGGTSQNRRYEVEFPPIHDDLAPSAIGLRFELFESEADQAIPPFFSWVARAGKDYFWPSLLLPVPWTDPQPAGKEEQVSGPGHTQPFQKYVDVEARIRCLETYLAGESRFVRNKARVRMLRQYKVNEEWLKQTREKVKQDVRKAEDAEALLAEAQLLICRDGKPNAELAGIIGITPTSAVELPTTD